MSLSPDSEKLIDLLVNLKIAEPNKMTETRVAPPVYTIKDITQTQISIIPVFDGNPNTLGLYLDSCEYLINTFANLNNINDPINAFLMRIFQSKLSGDALTLIGSRQTLTTWKQLREFLELNFTDQRSEECLRADLLNLRPFRSETPYNFGVRIKETLNLLLSKVKRTFTDAAKIAWKNEDYSELALQTYLRGICQISDLGHRVRFRNPYSLEIAMGYVIEEENFEYSVSRSNNLNTNLINTNFVKAPFKLAHSSKLNQPLNQPKLVADRSNFLRQNYSQIRQMQGSIHQNPVIYNPPPPPQPTVSNNKAQSFRFVKSPGQLESKRQFRSVPMDVDKSNFSRIPQNYYRPTPMETDSGKFSQNKKGYINHLNVNPAYMVQNNYDTYCERDSVDQYSLNDYDCDENYEYSNEEFQNEAVTFDTQLGAQNNANDVNFRLPASENSHQ